MTSTAQAISAKRSAPCLARQPILAKDEKVMGYEVLFQEHPDGSNSSSPYVAPGALVDTLKEVGLDVVCDGQLAFLRCTQQMLLQDAFFALPHDRVVVQIQSGIAVDAPVLEACERLKKRGYKIAIDGIPKGDDTEQLVPFADFVKVDPAKAAGDHPPITPSYARKPYKMLAQPVDSRAEYRNAIKLGFTLFQGYFFRHPENMRLRQIPASQTSKLRLLQAVSAPEIDLPLVEQLIRHDASLCYRLMRYLNSPVLGLATPVQSVRQAINLLGEQALTRWIRTATVLSMGQPKCSDLVLASLVRAHFCELIASKVDHGSADLFLLGMFSLMDSILETPIETLMEGLSFDTSAKAALLAMKIGGGARLSPICDLMVAREKGDWERVTTCATNLTLSLEFVNRAYLDAMEWAHQMTKAAHVQGNPAR
jgi:EAL and modified HD-GYP domain-containing signal transduction protein